jgi:hypothetical protein
MSDAAEFRVLSKRLKLFNNAIRAEIYPANHRANERILIRELQKPGTLFETLPRLHSDGSSDTSSGHDGQQVRRQVISAQLIHASGYPDVIAVVIFPKVVMRIDFHGSQNPHTQFC